MKRYNLIALTDKDFGRIVMCQRENPPYAGYLNLVGGTINEDETDLDSAYRELQEETGIDQTKTTLLYIMKLYYPIPDIELVVFAGKLNVDSVDLVNEVNPVFWMPLDYGFFSDAFAGEGNVGHIIEELKVYKDLLPVEVG